MYVTARLSTVIGDPRLRNNHGVDLSCKTRIPVRNDETLRESLKKQEKGRKGKRIISIELVCFKNDIL